jgi:hypothetical protein
MTTKIKSKGAQTSLKTSLNKATCKKTRCTIILPNLNITTGITTPTISETTKEALKTQSTSLLLRITRLDLHKNTILERSYEYVTKFGEIVHEKVHLYHIRWIWSVDF